MTDTIKPALTPEEWAEATESAGYLADMVEEAADDLAASFSPPDDKAFAPLSRVHALAALALHGLVVDGKPVGFTREHATLLRMADLDRYVDGDGKVHDRHPQRDLLDALAAIIEALLPPEVP